MTSKYSRLDRFISKKTNIKRKDIRLILAQKRIIINAAIATDLQQIIGPFDKVVFDSETLQEQSAQYFMLHKPVGVVCANHDKIHKTVFDLLNPINDSQLHIVGRLDLNTSGLVLITNDGKWSKSITSPLNKVTKEYQVELKNVLNNDYIPAFEKGMYFEFEDLTTQPAKLKITGERNATLTLTEGRYHQVKRMFGRFRNPVLKLHRSAIGKLELCNTLEPGQHRPLSSSELQLLLD
ncbi:MAG: pseudouridine synthase [Oceanospirillaceae bacterium]